CRCVVAEQRTIQRSAPTDHTIFSTAHYVATQLSTDRHRRYVVAMGRTIQRNAPTDQTILSTKH
ncbi:3885_t:CDS:2, partial [Acaulospora morrowiae]